MKMKRTTHMIQDAQPDGKGYTQPTVSLDGFLDLLDALAPDIEAEGGLLHVFAVGLRQELMGVLGYDE